MKVTVDRFEGGIAVLLVRPEETQTILFPRELLPGVEEGALLEVIVTPEREATREARKRTASLIDRLRKKGT